MAVSVNFRQYGFSGHTIVVTGRWRESLYGAEIFVTNMETGILSVTFVALEELKRFFSTRQQCELVLEKMAKGIHSTINPQWQLSK